MLAACLRGVASFSVLRAMFRHRYRRVVVSTSGVSLNVTGAVRPRKGSYRLWSLLKKHSGPAGISLRSMARFSLRDRLAGHLFTFCVSQVAQATAENIERVRVDRPFMAHRIGRSPVHIFDWASWSCN